MLEPKLKNLDNLLVCRVGYPFYVVNKTKVEIVGITIELVPQITIVDIVAGIWEDHKVKVESIDRVHIVEDEKIVEEISGNFVDQIYGKVLIVEALLKVVYVNGIVGVDL